MMEKKRKIPRLAKEKPYYIRESEDRLMDKFGTSVAIQEKMGKVRSRLNIFLKKI